jgi:AraC-like DNA-binding protein
VLRLQRFRALASLDLVFAAAEAGYADQAHLTRDCRALTGLTPRQLRWTAPSRQMREPQPVLARSATAATSRSTSSGVL